VNDFDNITNMAAGDLRTLNPLRPIFVDTLKILLPKENTFTINRHQRRDRP
jgi:hypothetical protein